MDEQLRQLRRNATTKEDTLELLARSNRAGPETIHYDTHAALDQFPADEDIVRAWLDAHCEAIIYLLAGQKDNHKIWVYGNQGKHQINADNEHVRSIVVDKTDIYLIEDRNQSEDSYFQCNWYRSLFWETSRSIELPKGNRATICSIITTSEGTFVPSKGETRHRHMPFFGDFLNGYRITNTVTGETKNFPYKEWEGGPTLGRAFSFQDKLAYSITQKGETCFIGWDGQAWTKEKQEQAKLSFDLRFGGNVLGSMMKRNLDSANLGEKEKFIARPISQHLYEKLLNQYGG